MVQYELEGNTFIISNKVYPYANLAQWGSDGRDMGTIDGQSTYDQLWILREDLKIKGFYTINNFTYVGSRVAKWGAGDRDTGNFEGIHLNDQLWKFEPHGSEENHYTITNYTYPKARMAKWGAGNGDWGSYAGGFSDDQVWRLVERFDAKLRTKVILSYSNDSPTLINQTITYKTGMTVTNTSSATQSETLEVSLTTSAEASGGGMSASVEAGLKSTISQSLSQSSSETTTWSEEKETEYVIPEYMKYVVTQNIMDYNGRVPGDNVQVMITNVDVTTSKITH